MPIMRREKYLIDEVLDGMLGQGREQADDEVAARANLENDLLLSKDSHNLLNQFENSEWQGE